MDMHEAERLRKVILLPRIDSHNNLSVSMISEFIINLGAAVPMVSQPGKSHLSTVSLWGIKLPTHRLWGTHSSPGIKSTWQGSGLTEEFTLSGHQELCLG